jgi:hypothetical protein
MPGYSENYPPHDAVPPVPEGYDSWDEYRRMRAHRQQRENSRSAVPNPYDRQAIFQQQAIMRGMQNQGMPNAFQMQAIRDNLGLNVTQNVAPVLGGLNAR